METRRHLLEPIRLTATISIACAIALAYSSCGNGSGSTRGWWARERAQRQAALDQYIEANPEEFESFKSAPIAIRQDALNFVGIQVAMFRLFPVIFPDIWGPPEEQMAEVGLGPDPFDPESVLPLGSGYHLSNGITIPGTSKTVQVNYVTLTCMACHSGGVTMRDGTLMRMVGAPNPIGDFSGTVNQTVNDPRYTAENFVNALNAEPLGWVYGDAAQLRQEELERALYNTPGGAEYFLEELKFFSNKATKRVVETFTGYTYNVPNPPPFMGPNVIPGQLDVFTYAAASLANPDVLTPAQMAAAMPANPAPSDIMAAWMQVNRPRFQWDDSVTNLTMRETAASLTDVAGDPSAVNQSNIELAGNFTLDLPPTPYPFEVDRSEAHRGALLFQQACQDCHAPGNTTLVTPAQTGTDPNRADVFTSFLATGLTAELREGCLVPSCYGPDGTELPDDEVLDPTYSYAAIPLTGIWATAPYLHNGSVPTLYHLLVGDRPATFYRGNTTYDETAVGFTWDRATSPRAVVYDTTQDGHSNAGHTGAAFSGGIDWASRPGELEELLEHLKTL